MTGLVLGGNKSLLFNAEYLINIAGPVRLVLFADAGQVRDTRRALRVEGRPIQRSGARAADRRQHPAIRSYSLANPLDVIADGHDRS